jgi:hypothetical protein
MRGQGVQKDYVVSLMWALISDVNATELRCLNEVDSEPLLKMTSEQDDEATDKANVWLKEHHYPPTEKPVRRE